jgi:dihydroorotate dehydrogenase electron transfer subunit
VGAIVTRVLRQARVLANRAVARATCILDLEMELEEPARAGQFAMVHPGIEGCLLPRPLSILEAAGGRLRLLVKEVGRGTRALAALRPGEAVRVFAPLGRPFDDPRLQGGPVILVAGGVGLVPLWRLLQERRASGATGAVALFGARTCEDLPTELLEGWRLWVEEDPGVGMGHGTVVRGFEEALVEMPDAVVATCGPTPMMQAVARRAASEGRPTWVCLEEQMGCGAGVCRACVVEAADHRRMRTVCREGPVFALDEIDYV